MTTPQSNIQAQIPVRLPQYQQQLDVIAMAGKTIVAASAVFGGVVTLTFSDNTIVQM